MRFCLKFFLVSATLLISVPTTVPLNTHAILKVLAQTPTPTAEDRIREGVYLNQQGRDDYEKGRPQEALEKFQSALAIFRELKARAGEANSLNNIGEVYFYSLEKYDEALKFYQQALAIRREIGDKEGEWASLDYLGELYATRNQLPQALDSYQQALAIIKQLTTAPSSDSSLLTSERIRLNNIGGVYFRMSQYDKALESYQQALAIHKKTSDRIGEAQTLNNIGVIYVNQSQYQNALDSYEQALNIVREIGNCYRKDPGPKLCYYGDEAAILNNMAALYFSIGQYQKALEISQRASEIYNRLKANKSRETNLDNLKLLYEALGQNSRSLGVLSQELARRAPVGAAVGKDSFQLTGEALNFNNIGQIYANLGQYDRALNLYQQALANYKELSSKLGQAITINNIGQTYTNLDQYPKSLESYQQALAIYKEVGDKTGVGVVLSNIGQLYNVQGQYPKAMDFYQQALAIHREVGDKAGQGTTLNNIGNSLLSSGNFAEATSQLLGAMEVLESLRPGLNDSDKIAIVETQTKTYRSLQQAFIAQNKSDRALEIAERGRARVFVELLARRLATTARQNSATLPALAPLTLEEIKQIARTQKATLVEYSLLPENAKVQTKPRSQESELFIWVVKPTGEVALRRADLKSLRQSQETGERIDSLVQNLVLSTRESIGARGLTVVQRPGTQQRQEERKSDRLQQLHKLLIEPIADLLPTDPKERVIFIPQGSLFLVPFAALQDKTGKYLIEQHTILTAPAIQVLQLTHQQQERLGGQSFATLQGKDVLVVGNPTMPKISLTPGEPPQQLPSLPGAEREALEIATLLKTQAITGDQASKVALLPQLPQARLVHLATHGILDDIRGLGSAIALAPSGNDNGLLTAEEILNLKLNAELVVLSACDTGRGRITGDGVVGLSRSLIAAGVPSVIVSLWSVPDTPTASLMTAYYQNLQNNLDKAQALRNAMLTTLKQYPNPINWAAFVLIGEAE